MMVATQKATQVYRHTTETYPHQQKTGREVSQNNVSFSQTYLPSLVLCLMAIMTERNVCERKNQFYINHLNI